MALPPLDHVLSPVPAFPLGMLLHEIAQTLDQPGAAVPSHIVVIDDQRRPLGAISLGRLWAAYYRAAPELSTKQRLMDYRAALEAVVEIRVTRSATETVLTPASPFPLVANAATVVVDAEGHYLGMIDPGLLLSWLASPAGEQAAPAADTLASPAQWGPHRAWVLELSHALKTPITTLLGLSTLLLDSRVGSLSDRQFRYVSLMRQAIRKLTGLINLLLDWMWLESDQISLNRQQVYLQSLAESLLPSFLSAQSDPQMDWADDFTICLATPEGWVMADPQRLRQSLHYLLGYLIAQQATPGGLIIEPWGPWLGLTLWGSGSRVTDPADPSTESSPGVSLAEQASLEELALALAHRLSQLHGGELSCFSTPTWGRRITLLLPSPDRPTDQENTVLVLLATASDEVIDRVYGGLRGSPYRLAVAPSCETLVTLQQRLQAPYVLLHWESMPAAPTETAARLALVQSLGNTQVVILSPADGTASRNGAAPIAKTLPLQTLDQGLRPALDQLSLARSQPPPETDIPAGLTILLLRPEAGKSVLPATVQAWLQRYRCRLLQVDDLEQASLLSRVWQPQAVILDQTSPPSLDYLRALADYPALVDRPLVTLVTLPDWEAALDLGLPLVLCTEVLTQPTPQAATRLLEAIAQHDPSRSA